MIERIVKLPIDPKGDNGLEFEALFNRYKQQIAAAPGCTEVRLLRSQSHYFTYSYWESEDALNQYRFSPVFGEVWPQTKALFYGQAEAWTCERIEKVKS